VANIEIIIIIKAIFLGIIEGMTEFIPVSSTAHLLLFSQIINFDAIKNHVFEIAIQIGAIFAVAVVYRHKFSELLLNFYQKDNQKYLNNIGLAFFPAVIVGFLFHDIIKQYFFSNHVMAMSLIIGGIAIILIENILPKIQIKKIENITAFKAIAIGIFQCLAMIPGVSRSGSTIMGALILGIERKAATEFSFFLAVPTIGSACLYDIYKNFDKLIIADIHIILIGIISSFISSLLVIKWLIKFVSNNNFIFFGYYRIIVGLAILFFLV